RGPRRPSSTASWRPTGSPSRTAPPDGTAKHLDLPEPSRSGASAWRGGGRSGAGPTPRHRPAPERPPRPHQGKPDTCISSRSLELTQEVTVASKRNGYGQ